MKETSTPQGNLSLVRLEVVDQLRHSLTPMGGAEMGDALLLRVKKHADYLEHCSQQAEGVLNGDLGAANRLWLLLKEPVSACPIIPPALLDEIAQHAQVVEPRAIDGDVLLRLIAAVVRAANQPVEADAMLHSLQRLLEPLFLTDVAAASAQRGQHGNLQTLITAWSSPDWRAAWTEPCVPKLNQESNTRNHPVLHSDRLPFNPATWRDVQLTDEFPLWKTWICPGNVRTSMSQIDRFGGRYTIDSLSNPGACSGETITIRGRDFGPTGRVFFPSPDVDDPAFGRGVGDLTVLSGVEPVRWTDTEIDVVVPPWATSGELHLNAFKRHRDPCSTIDVFRLGNSILFEGGLAGVFAVSIAGNKVDLSSTKPTNLTPGDVVAMAWHASVGPTVKVAIRFVSRGVVLGEQKDLPGGFAATPVEIPDPKEPREATLEFSATSSCGATQPLRIPVFLNVPPRLTIQYVEVTQGVQGDLADVQAGREMPVVANKDTAVRVHMHCDRGGWFQNRLDRITGVLFVDGRQLGPTNKSVLPPLSRGFASISGLSRPTVTNDTLNFTIPAAWLTPGTHTLNVRVVRDDPSGTIVLEQSFPWTWQAKAPLRVRAVWMGPSPSIPFLLDYTRRVLDFLPTPLTGIGIARISSIPHDSDLSTRADWQDLLDGLELLWDVMDESGARWLGVVPPKDWGPSAPFGIATTPGMVLLAMGDRLETGAHEMGHSLGLHHVNQPPGGPDGPHDEVDGGGLLRRAPFDVRTSEAKSLPAVDIMGYPPLVRSPGITTWFRLFLMDF